MRPEIDETVLTAYALGELGAPARSQVAAVVKADAAAAEYVEQVRETAGVVTAELAAEASEGLTQLHLDVIEQRLAAKERAGRFSRPAPSRRLPHWVPFAASIAASVAIVGGTLVYLAPKLSEQPRTTAKRDGGGTVAVAPPYDDSRSTPLNTPADDLAANALLGRPEADGEVDAFEEEPVEGMVDPRELRDDTAAKKKVQPRSTQRPKAAKKAPAQPAKSAPAAGPALARGPARSPEAEEVRASKKAAAPPATGSKTANRRGVYAAPPSDPKTFREIVKTGKVEAAPKLYQNPFRTAAQRPRSSFPVRVENGSYDAIRDYLAQNQLPPLHVVRIEELVNRFAYSDSKPAADGSPLAAGIEITTCPWDIEHRLARVAIRARDGGASVARGVEVDVEFDPATTATWRLIGYENAPLAAGQTPRFPTDLSAGGSATAFYEIVPVAASSSTPADLFTLSVRYRDAKDPAEKKIQLTATDTGRGFDRASADFRFATAVAGFGLLLRDSQFKGTATFPDVIRWATAGKGADETREREAFIELAKQALILSR